MDASGAADPSFGVRQFVIGTGGAGLSGFGTILPTSEVRDNATHGVMKFTLHASSYDWQFIPIAGQTFTDSGTSSTHGAPGGSAQPPVADFDGDGDTDLSVFRPSQGGWYMQGQPPFPQIWGALGDLSVPGDYDGNGTVDIAVFRNGQWYVKGQPPFPQIWGQAGDVPVPGDYDGNGTTDIAVFRSGQWYVRGQPPFPQIWGTNCDIPQPFPYALRTLIPHGGCADG